MNMVACVWYTYHIVVNDSVKLAMGYSYDRNGSATVIVID